MRTPFISICIICLFAACAIGQTFVPTVGSSLTNGDVGSPYAGQTIIASVPATTTITGQQLLDGGDPIMLNVVQGSIDPSADYVLSIDSVKLTVANLPAGMTENCNGCEVQAGTDGSIVISGSPTMEGNFSVVILSQTTGETVVDTGGGQVILPFGGSFDILGIGAPFPISRFNGLMNANYTVDVTNTGNLPSISVGTTASSNCNGAAEVTVYSGVGPFNYSFSSGQSGPESIITSLCPDVYSVEVEDANGGVVNATFVIAESVNVYGNIFGLPGDTLYSSPLNLCDLDFNAPIDSFSVTQLVKGH